MVVLITDLFDEPEHIIRALNHFAHKKHDVILFHVLDRKEREFPFRDLTRFESLEGEEIIITEPLRLKREYLKQFEEHERTIKKACHHLHIDFISCVYR